MSAPGTPGPPPVADPDQLTATWVTAALAAAGRPAEVVALTTERVGTGQMGTAYRLHLHYAPGHHGPDRLVAKLPAADPEARASVAVAYQREVAFYREVAPTVDVAVPACWYAAIDDTGEVFTLLLDDLAPAVPGVQVDGCTPEVAVAALRNLAGLHAPRWSDVTLSEVEVLDHLDREGAEFLGMLLAGAADQFSARYDGVIDAGDLATLREAAAATAVWLTTRLDPFAVVHGDYRLDNLLFGPDGAVTTVDWQTANLGPPLRDVAYFLGTSLEVEDRRRHEHELVAAYRAEVTARGVTGYGAARCFEDYRLGQLQGPLVTILGSEYATASRTPEADAMFLAMARRSAAALRDLDSVALVGALADR